MAQADKGYDWIQQFSVLDTWRPGDRFQTSALLDTDYRHLELHKILRPPGKFQTP